VLAGGLADVVGAAVTISVLGGMILLAAPFLGRLPQAARPRPELEHVFETT